MNVPSTKTINQRLDWLNKVGDPAALAKQIRKELKTFADYAGAGFLVDKRLHYHFSALDALLQTQGMEYVAHRLDDRHGSHGLTFLNTGDTYTATIIYDHHRGTLAVTSWGDIVESRPNDYT